MSVTKIAMDVEMDVERIEMLPSATAASKHIPKVEIEIVEDEEKGKPRQAWNNKTEYLLAMVGNAVGIGNIWRFPYQCQKHGGGAFIIPYLIVLGLIGYPMLLLEIGMGQRYKSGAVALWSKLSPYTAGIGISSLMICAILTSYYIIVPSWAFVYAASSFTSPLPFASCPLTAESNYTVEVAECAASSPNVYYWYRQTLNVPDAIEIGGGLNWKILVADLVCVILIFIGLQRGVQSTGRCMYFAVVFPYVVLIAFLIRALTLEGCAEGISYLLRTDVAKLGDMSVWQAAITQIFFSIGLGYGVYVAQASYMPQGNNCTFDVIFVATVNSVTSLLATLIVFAVLGFKAMMNEQKCHARNDLLLESIANSTQNVTLESGSKAIGVTEQNLLNVTLEKCSYQKELDNAVGGPGLAFIAFAEAIVMFPGANFWSLLFFLMLASVGLSSIMGTLTGIIASLRDIGCKMRKIPLAACLCTVLFLLSLIFTLNCGSYMVEILDDNVGTLTLFPVVLCEVVATCYVYGIKRFCDDLKHMTGYRPGWYWKITLAVCCPLLLAVAIVGGYVNYGMNPLKYSMWNSALAEEVKIFYPHWCIPLIIVLAFLILVSIPAAAVLHKTGLVNMSNIFH